MSDDKDYSAEHKAVISRESQKLERARAKAESLESNMTKGLAAALRANRASIGKDAMSSVQRTENGALSAAQRAMLDAAARGIDLVQIDEGPVTGFEEQKRYSDED